MIRPPRKLVFSKYYIRIHVRTQMQHNWIVKKKKPAGRHTRSQKRADSAASGWSMQSHGQEQTWQAWGQATTAGKYHITQATIWHWTSQSLGLTHTPLIGKRATGVAEWAWSPESQAKGHGLTADWWVWRGQSGAWYWSAVVGLGTTVIVLYTRSTYQMQFNYKNVLIILTASKWKKSNMTQPQR